jgi:putative ABC transport system substrate-binding protein
MLHAADRPVHAGRRRLLGALGLACASPAALAQPPRMRTVGYFSGGAGVDVLTPHLAKFGYSEGRNVRFVVRTAPDKTVAPPKAVAAQLVAARPDALLVFSSARARLLFDFTRSIPIVATGLSDPVGMGMARTLARPGGNVTGLSHDYPATWSIQIGLLRAFLPRLARLVLLLSPAAFSLEDTDPFVRGSAAAGVALDIVPVSSPEGVGKALDSIRDRATEAALVGGMPDAWDHTALAHMVRSRRIVASWAAEAAVEQGGLMCYARTHSRRIERTMAVLAKVLDGTDPGEIPFELPDITLCVVNPAAARAIDLKVPEEVMLRATRVVA